MSDNVLWVEKYRPQRLEDIIIPQSIRDQFKDGLKTNLLLSGTCGTGKTTLGKILCKGHSVKFINASMNNGIDTVRNEIQDFVAVGSLINRDLKKVVFLDEADNFTADGQKSLRGFIEQYHNNALFILTANYPEKIIDALKSRLTEIQFNYSDADEKYVMQSYIDRIRGIAEHNKVQISDDAIAYLIKTRYPDLRKIIGDMQTVVMSNKNTSVFDMSYFTKLRTSKYDELYEFLLNEHKPEKIYAYVKSKYLNKETEAMKALSSEFLKYLSDNGKLTKVIAVAAIAHKYNYEMPQSIDKFVTLLACCGSIAEILKK